MVQQLVCCCRVQGQLSGVQFLQDFGHAICPQVYLYKMRKPELPVVERCCLNKHRGCHFLVEFFWVGFCFFFFQVINLGSISLFFSSLRTSPLIFQPSLAVFSHAQVPHSGDSKAPKANITLRVISTSHSQADTGSPPWRDDPLLQNYNSLCLSCCSLFFWRISQPCPSFLEAGWTDSNWRASQSNWISLWETLPLTPASCSVRSASSPILPTQRNKWTITDNKSQEQCLDNQSPALKK